MKCDCCDRLAKENAELRAKLAAAEVHRAKCSCHYDNAELRAKLVRAKDALEKIAIVPCDGCRDMARTALEEIEKGFK